jgi:hypothetical protein
MSHFLARLVERARGTASRVEPVVAPRFGQAPIVEIASQVETPPSERSGQEPTMEEKSSPRAAVQPEARTEKTEPKISRESNKPSLPQQPAKLLVPVEMSKTDPTAFVRSSPFAAPSVPAVSNRTLWKNSVTASRSKRPRPATLLATTSRNLERDSLTPNESSEQQPIVRVTIGRIDVRATPQAVPSRKSATPLEPKLTLDAYLKSRREGTR